MNELKLKSQELAKSFRQAIGGCSMHQHGPVYAVLKLLDALERNEVDIDCFESALKEFTDEAFKRIDSSVVDIDNKTHSKEVAISRFTKLIIQGVKLDGRIR